MKRCSKCGIEKPLEEFSNYHRHKDGKQSWCKQCYKDRRMLDKEKLKISRRNYVTANKEAISERGKQYRSTHKEKIGLKKKEHYFANREKILQKNKVYRDTHKEEQAKYSKDYRDKNKEKIVLRRKIFRAKNRDKLLENDKKYRIENREKIKEYRIETSDERYKYSREYFKTPKGKLIKAKSVHIQRCNREKTECSLTVAQWEKIITLQQNRCLGCNKLFTKQNPATKDHIIPVIPYNGAFTMENTQALCRSCNSKKHNRLDKSNIIVWISALAQEA
jgi:5-methylcytosine-specific restriction endonuclease McrA